jgi:methanogenic corrinoid protein MtbC1
MTLEDLVAGARALPPASPEAAEAYGAAREAMVARVNADLHGREDLPRLLGGAPTEVMVANHLNHADFMSNVFALQQHELLARSLPWIYRTYRARGFSYDYFPVELRAWCRAVAACVPAGRTDRLLACYRWMIERHADVVALSGEKPAPGAAASEPDRWTGPREQYLAALLAGDPAAALALSRAVVTPDDLEDFFLSVIQPAMYAIGERWEAGEVSVAGEHLASAITNRVVAGLSTGRKLERPWRGLAVVSAAPNEFHELGAWMVSDLLEADGWEVSYLGANTPTDDLVALVGARQPALLALSVTMPFSLERTRAIIAAVKARPRTPPVRFLVGGRVFNDQPELWREVGADAWARDAHDAILAARGFGRTEPRR